MRQHFKKGEVIISQGSRGDRSFRILEGEVLVCYEPEKDQLIPITKLGKNALFGEMFTFDSEGRRSATVIGNSDNVMVEVIFETDLLHELQPINKTAMDIIIDLTKRLYQTTGQYAHQVIQSGPDSYH